MDSLRSIETTGICHYHYTLFALRDSGTGVAGGVGVTVMSSHNLGALGVRLGTNVRSSWQDKAVTHA